MRRSSLVTTFTVAVVAAVAPISVAYAADAGTPTAGDDNATVCKATQDTASEGLETFVKHMTDVSTKASSGDLEGAQTSVRYAGNTLVDVSGQLREDAANADDHQLKETVNYMAAEFENLGKQLTDLTRLQDFDTTGLDALAGKMSEFCGVTSGPGQPSGGPRTPSQTASG